MNFLDYSGLQRFLDRLKAIIPTKTSDITNDSGYLDTTGVQNYMENGGGYSQSYIDTALSGKADSSHTHTKSEITDFPTLATVATSGSYNDLSNTPTIPTVNNAKLTIQRNGTTVKTFTANSASDVTTNITVPTAVSELTNDSGYLTSSSSLDSSKLTGTIDIARLPKGALERLVTVANQTARFALTTSDVQLGDTVKQLDTGVMYIVTDESKLSSADGYTEYTAGSATSVPWSGVTGKPSSYTPSSHTHGNVTNDGKLGTASRALITNNNNEISVSNVTATELNYLSGVTSNIQSQLGNKATSSHSHGNIANGGTLGTASRALITDGNKKITTSSVTSTELGYLSGVTSSVQTQLNGKAASTHVHGNITNDGKVGTTANLPLITGTGGVVQAGSFGNAANTFCEGNDARLSDARTPVAHTHTKSDVTDLLNSNFIPSSNGSYNLGSLTNRWGTVYGIESNVRSDKIDFTDTTTTGTKAHWHLSNAEKNGSTFFQIGSQRNHSNGLNEEHFRIKNANDKWADLYIQLDDNNQFTIGTTTHSDVTNNGFKGKFTPFDSFIPYTNNSYDLGSSGKQWNNLYAKNYFYNGTPWGLDKENTWTQTQAIYNANPKFRIRNSYLTKGYAPSVDLNCSFFAQDSSGDEFGRVLSRVTTNGDTITWLAANNLYKNGQLDPAGNSVWANLICAVSSTGEPSVVTNCDFLPDNNSKNLLNLGNSSRKWKTLNGINPGSLSFPSGGTTENTDWFDISGAIKPVGGNATDFTGNRNDYIPPVDGWLALTVNDCSKLSVWCDSLSYGQNSISPNSTEDSLFLMPVIAGKNLDIRIKGTSWYSARLIVPKGNV